MDFEIRHRPSFAAVDVNLERDEAIQAEAGAMVTHTSGIDVETNASGGVFSSLKRSVLGGESFFVNTFRASEPASVTLAPPLPGDVLQRDLENETLYVQSSSYLAADGAIDVDTEFGGARSFFGGEGLFLLKLSGTGPAVLSSYGAIDEVELDAGESLTVDTGHIVAFDGPNNFDVRRVGGLKSTLFSGEGLVCEFEGPRTVWTQTRSPDAFLAWLIPKLPSSSSNTGN